MGVNILRSDIIIILNTKFGMCGNIVFCICIHSSAKSYS